MKIHEYQAKELFRRYAIPVPAGRVAATPDEAAAAAATLGHFPVIVKAQMLAGGRGKAGGIRTAASEAEARQAATELLGMTLVTRQTGLAGRVVNKVLVEEVVAVAREFYLAIMVDRDAARIMLVASAAGGMEIEEAAAESPERISRVAVDPLIGLRPYHGRQLTQGLGLAPAIIPEFLALLASLYALFVDYDCSLLEINPLALTEDGVLLALDAKLEIDSNSLFRHADIAALRDPAEEDPLEAEAVRHGLRYIKLTGNVGNLVNGAGLAMATMDLIKRAGAEPANFLDVGGGADAQQVEHGLRIILSDPAVKAVLINIFGGILRCDVLATGIVQAARHTGLRVPVVIRMEGTNVGEGRRILDEAGLNLIVAPDLTDAAAKIAQIIQPEKNT